MSSVGESGDGQADTTIVAESASAISAYDAGGTMYFYAGGDEMVSNLTHPRARLFVKISPLKQLT